MICEKPYCVGVMEYGCGKCDPCRYNRGRRWVGRILLESLAHPHSIFLTLTYNVQGYNAHLRSLSKTAFTWFLKRLRFGIRPRKIRYFAAGEYGGKTKRPHFHAIIFGLSNSDEDRKEIEAAWSENGQSLGFVCIGTVSPRSIHYVALDLLKGVGDKKGFTLKSQGLGKNALPYFTKSIASNPAVLQKMMFQGTFRLNGNIYGFGSYLKKKLLNDFGFVKEDFDNYLNRYAMERVQPERVDHEVPWWIRRKSILEVQRGKLQLMKERRQKI